MTLGRRFVALTLNVSLLQSAWTSGREACAPVAGHEDSHTMAMAPAAHGGVAPASGAITEKIDHDCSGTMEGADCAAMLGCVTVSPLASRVGFGGQRRPVGLVIAFDAQRVALAAAAPEPPPPRA